MSLNIEQFSVSEDNVNTIENTVSTIKWTEDNLPIEDVFCLKGLQESVMSVQGPNFFDLIDYYVSMLYSAFH